MTTKAPKFLRVLYDILDTEPASIIAWSPCGTFFQVRDVARLEQYVLPRYFKHNKFASFQRQLNNFGFRKWTKTRASVCTFNHDVLVQCKPNELISLVVAGGIVSPHVKVGAKRERSESCGSESGSAIGSDCDEAFKKQKHNEAVEAMESVLDLMLDTGEENLSDLWLDLLPHESGDLEWLLSEDASRLAGVFGDEDDIALDIDTLTHENWSDLIDCL